MLFQFLGGLQGFPYEVTGGKNRKVFAFVHHIGLPDDERLVGIGEIGHGGTAETQIDGAVVFRGGDGRLLRLVVVAGVDDHHLGQSAHQGDIFHRLVGGAVFAEGDAGVGRSNLDIGLTIGYLLTDLVIHATRHKFGERTDERNLPGDGESGCGADHIGFRNTALYETLGEFGGECIHFYRAFEVGGEGENTLIRFSGSEQTCAKTAAGIFFTCISIFFHNLWVLLACF